MRVSDRNVRNLGARLARSLGAGIVASVWVASAATAADHPGKAPYDQYCASCHGEAADGKGPVAEEMKIEPSNLRKLAERYGDPLPKPRLREIIDGREMLRSHGTPNMPVWGEKLVENVPPGAGKTFFTRGTIFSIIDYLQTLQPKKQ